MAERSPTRDPSALRVAFEPLLTAGFRTWWRLSRGMTLGVRGIALDAQGRVLLVRHTYQRGWHLPGGGVEHGETCATALAREMAEEAGVKMTAPAQLLGVYSNHAHFRNDHVLVFRIHAWTPCTPTHQNEIAEHGAFPPDALPDGTSAAVRARIAEACLGGAPSETW